MTLPKISCLTATRNRLSQLKESIRCYCAQSYPSREMVIATEAGERYCRAIRSHFEFLGRSDYKLIPLDRADYTLGAIRNILLDAAEGEVVCQWDDDDQYHPQRLQVQAQHMLDRDAEACFFTDQLQFFWREREMFWTDWTIGGTQGTERLVPGTMMMYPDGRSRYPETGSMANRHEDAALLTELAQNRSIAELSGAGYLYVYVYHGRNTFEEDHHRRITSSHARDAATLRRDSETLIDALANYTLPMPYVVKSSLGEAALSYAGAR